MPYKNKADQAACARRHYERNTQKLKDRAKVQNKLSKIDKTRIKREYLLTHPCVDCGEADIRCLDFDHVRGTKKGNISQMRSGSQSIGTFMREIEKCEVRCANCHRKRTHDTLWVNPDWGRKKVSHLSCGSDLDFMGHSSIDFLN